jgi:hypothetical protein
MSCAQVFLNDSTLLKKNLNIFLAAGHYTHVFLGQTCFGLGAGETWRVQVNPAARCTTDTQNGR